MTQHVENVEELNKLYTLHTHFFKLPKPKSLKAIVKVVALNEREPVVELVKHVESHTLDAEQELRVWALQETTKIKTHLGIAN